MEAARQPGWQFHLLQNDNVFISRPPPGIMASYFSDPQELSQQDPHAFAEEATVDILAKNHCLVVWGKRLCPLSSRHLNLLPQQDSITSNLNYFPETGERLSRSENVIRAAAEIGAGSRKRLKRRFGGTAPWDAFRVWLAASARVVLGFFCCCIFFFLRWSLLPR